MRNQTRPSHTKNYEARVVHETYDSPLGSVVKAVLAQCKGNGVMALQAWVLARLEETRGATGEILNADDGRVVARYRSASME